MSNYWRSGGAGKIKGPILVAGAATGILLVIVGLVALGQNASSKIHSASKTVSTATTLYNRPLAAPLPTSTTPEPATTTTVVTPLSPELQYSVTQIATQFVTNWAMPTRSQADWINAIKPYADPQYLQLALTVNPLNIHSTKVTGQATFVTGDSNQALVNVPTDAGIIAIIITHEEPHWAVTNLQMTSDAPEAEARLTTTTTTTGA